MQITFNPIYQELPIMTDEAHGLGCRTDILDRLCRLMTFYTQKHNKTLFIRFDLRFPEHFTVPEDNTILSKFLDSFKTKLTRMGLSPSYLWVREQSREKHQHYHLVLLLNGSLVQNFYHILQLAEYYWGLALGCDASGLVDFCLYSRNGLPQSNGLMLRRNTLDFVPAFQTCFHWASYLAKENTKGYGPQWTKEYGSSRIPSLKVSK
ncbi:hypothetical protein C4J81_01765 [Deltaproteobacteria bacterium Smac51]|nr:hypothetical protein C4J81_01765 [Deltaproteobacteria bacterium Smac51]